MLYIKKKEIRKEKQKEEGVKTNGNPKLSLQILPSRQARTSGADI